MSAQRCKEILCSNLAGGLADSKIAGEDFTFERKAAAYSRASADLGTSGESPPAEWLAEMIVTQGEYIDGGTDEKYVAACADLWDQLTA